MSTEPSTRLVLNEPFSSAPVSDIVRRRAVQNSNNIIQLIKGKRKGVAEQREGERGSLSPGHCTGESQEAELPS